MLLFFTGLWGAILIGFGAWIVWSPREVWETTGAWMYKNPKAVEPSDAAFQVSRLGGVGVLIIGGLFLLFTGFQVADGGHDEPPQAEI